MNNKPNTQKFNITFYKKNNNCVNRALFVYLSVYISNYGVKKSLKIIIITIHIIKENLHLTLQ